MRNIDIRGANAYKSARRAQARAFSGSRFGRRAPMPLIRYLSKLSTGRLILWCYFIWYCVVLVRYADFTPRLWLTSLGLSAIIGIALYISTTAAGRDKVKLGFWPTFRLFLMPFCVSSFSALVKGKGFILVFSPHPSEILMAATLCGALCAFVAVLKWQTKSAWK